MCGNMKYTSFVTHKKYVFGLFMHMTSCFFPIISKFPAKLSTRLRGHKNLGRHLIYLRLRSIRNHLQRKWPPNMCIMWLLQVRTSLDWAKWSTVYIDDKSKYDKIGVLPIRIVVSRFERCSFVRETICISTLPTQDTTFILITDRLTIKF